ncbi:MAG: aminotransferase class V-fold PLP-dependent enzyme [Bacteroidia bacterium]|nr:aminotransferase class V-fold PLP-dependent enzyme [Bacteroidia bacterium]
MNIDNIRSDILDYGEKIFVNSAGSSLMPHSVVEVIQEYLHQEEIYGGYKVEAMAAEALADFYVLAARLLHCQPRNIAFAHDATDAYTKALSSLDFQPGDLIITSDDDYASNHIQFISLKKRYGIIIERIRNLDNGDLDIEHFERLIYRQHPRLVAITHVPTNSGKIQDVEAIGKICREKEIIFLVDACQSIGQLDVNVGEIQCDFLSATGRKFLRGPRGTGLLYVSDRMLDSGYAPLFIDGGGAVWKEEGSYEMIHSAQRFELWEAPYALMIGMKEAIRYALDVGLVNIQDYNQELIQQLRSKMESIHGVTIYDQGSRKCNILTFRKSEKSIEELITSLEAQNVVCGLSQRHWGLIDYGKKGIDGTVRLSPHYFNTLDEMDNLVQIIDAI